MKVYIRHIDDGDNHLLTEVDTLEQAKAIAESVSGLGAYTAFGNVETEFMIQYLVDVNGRTGFEIIVGPA